MDEISKLELLVSLCDIGLIATVVTAFVLLVW